MRAIIQRVQAASVEILGHTHAAIKNGMLVLVGIEHGDDAADVEWLSRKLAALRIFNDEDGVMNKSLIDTGGELLLISQFTLHASTKKGNRPSYIKAAHPDVAVPVYEQMISALETVLAKPISTGVFGADMKVHLINDGPVTIFIDTKNKE